MAAGSPWNSGLDLSVLASHHQTSDNQGASELLVLAPEAQSFLEGCVYMKMPQWG